MTNELGILMGFISSLALVALLALGYSALRRGFQGPNVAPMLLGLLFGVVTIIQMHIALSPMEGLIIDMRNVPIALAGAFLGVRGLAICLTLAIATRYGIGGVGWIPGVIAMCIAGSVGLLWDRITRTHLKRGAVALIALGVGMCAHLIAAFTLPYDVAIWFLTIAAPPLVVLNLISVPLVGALLERERCLLQTEQRLQAAAMIDPATGFLTKAAFAREVSHAAARSDAPIAGIMVAQLRNSAWLKQHLGAGDFTRLAGALRHRLKTHVTHSEILGQGDDGQILVPITAAEAQSLENIEIAVRRCLSENAIVLAQGKSPLLVLDCRAIPLNDAADTPAVLAAISARAHATAKQSGKTDRPMRATSPAEFHHALFAKTETLRQAVHG